MEADQSGGTAKLFVPEVIHTMCLGFRSQETDLRTCRPYVVATRIEGCAPILILKHSIGYAGFCKCHSDQAPYSHKRTATVIIPRVPKDMLHSRDPVNFRIVTGSCCRLLII